MAGAFSGAFQSTAGGSGQLKDNGQWSRWQLGISCSSIGRVLGRDSMYEMKYKLTVIASGFTKWFTTREAAERWARLVLGLKPGAYEIDPIE
jgi:hypothetical protein